MGSVFDQGNPNDPNHVGTRAWRLQHGETQADIDAKAAATNADPWKPLKDVGTGLQSQLSDAVLPKLPTLPTAPGSAPTLGDDAIQQARRDELARLMGQAGLRSTFVSGPLGVTNQPTLGRKGLIPG